MKSLNLNLNLNPKPRKLGTMGCARRDGRGESVPGVVNVPGVVSVGVKV